MVHINLQDLQIIPNSKNGRWKCLYFTYVKFISHSNVLLTSLLWSFCIYPSFPVDTLHTLWQICGHCEFLLFSIAIVLHINMAHKKPKDRLVPHKHMKRGTNSIFLLHYLKPDLPYCFTLYWWFRPTQALWLTNFYRKKVAIFLLKMVTYQSLCDLGWFIWDNFVNDIGM